MFDTGIIPAGTFGGQYDIEFFYDYISSSETQGLQVMEWEIYENGSDTPVKLPETTFQFDGVNRTLYTKDLNTVLGVHRYGLHIRYEFKASYTYQIKIKTSSGISDRTAILDYISIRPAGLNEISDGRPEAQCLGTRGAALPTELSDKGSKLVMEVIEGRLGTSGTATWNAGPILDDTNRGFTYNTDFKTILAAYPIGGSQSLGRIGFSIYGYDYANKHVLLDGNVIVGPLTVSLPFKIFILVVGYI